MDVTEMQHVLIHQEVSGVFVMMDTMVTVSSVKVSYDMIFTVLNIDRLIIFSLKIYDFKNIFFPLDCNSLLHIFISI